MLYINIYIYVNYRNCFVIIYRLTKNKISLNSNILLSYLLGLEIDFKDHRDCLCVKFYSGKVVFSFLFYPLYQLGKCGVEFRYSTPNASKWRKAGNKDIYRYFI